MDEAIDFINDIICDKTGSPKVWKHALAGLWGQIHRREIAVGEVLRFLANAASKKHPDYRGINYVRVTGKRNGETVVSIRRLPVSGPGTAWTSMAAGTGSATAAFMVLAVDELGDLAGVLAPEDWADPKKFYDALARTGRSTLEDTVEAIVTVGTR
jgi:saccharopine dehydrogenase-like NADP-dependent oxidoreductase